jgi:hypothetical protein
MDLYVTLTQYSNPQKANEEYADLPSDGGSVTSGPLPAPRSTYPLFVPETEEPDVESPLPQFDAVETIGSASSDDDNIPIAQTLDSDEEFTAPSTVMKPKLGLLGIGTEVMRQFDAGLFLGTVQAFNSKDGLYRIKYSMLISWPWTMGGTQTTCHRATQPMKSRPKFSQR